MMLVTAFTAFRMLGGDYRWKTEFKTNGPIKGDTLKGNVYWVGAAILCLTSMIWCKCSNRCAIRAYAILTDI